MTPAVRRRAALVATATALLTASGCGDPHPAGTPPPAHAVTRSGVRVSAVLTSDSTVRVRLRPLRRGFHLYSLDMPDGGVDGLGVPTRITVGGGLTARGRARADVAAYGLHLSGPDVTLPVYPNGPVTFTIPVEPTGPGAATVEVSYGACSRRVCLIPVHDLVIRVASRR
ncbi:hypothetical protein GCM10027076_11250 [Nocardioides montaniterrae]